ncbi:MAG: CoA-binding protein [Anaerolineales bacterium]|nr:CoA-binding protein [Anaerolineales bacterium]
MLTLKEAAQEFLAQKRIAVAGVSRQGDTAANAIYKKLRQGGYDVFPVNPNAAEVEGDRCYPTLAAIPGGVEAVVIATHPNVTEQVVRECAALGIKRLWMHRSFGQGSVDDEAVRLCAELGLSVIPGSCPLMFCEPVDVGHKCLRWFLQVSGKAAKPNYNS